MKIKTLHWFCGLLAGLVLAGCSSMPMQKMPMQKMPAEQEMELFTQGLDQYLASGELTALIKLVEKYPKGEWRPRAEGLIELAKQQQQQHTKLQKKEQQFARCRTEKDTLVTDNQRLEVTLGRLKQVLIDMELRPE
jgi:hypothetical protein